MKKPKKKIIASFLGMFLLAGLMSACSNNPEKPDDDVLKIVSQPQTVTIDYGASMEMKVEVNNPKLVKSYQWYNALYDEDDQEMIKEHPLLGTKAKTNSYNLASYYIEPGDIQGFKCKITDINDKVLETDWALVNVNETVDDWNQFALGDYPIPLGKTFDLSTTPYGTGTITVNEIGNHFVFDNVMFTNEFMDSNFNGFGFRAITFDPSIEEYTFEFNGFNCFHNVYWNEEMYDGGAIFQVQALGLDFGDTRPATFKGNGTVSFYGGTYGIYGYYIDMYQDIDMNFYGAAGRPSKGLFASNYTLCKGRSLVANVSSVALDVVDQVTLKEDSCFTATLTSAPFSPMSINHLSGISTAGDVDINSANVKINVLLNAKKEFDDDYTVLASGIITQSNVYIENSSVDISIKEYNNDFEAPMYVYASSPSASSITGEDIEVSNSNIYITTNGKYISEARAINGQNFNASDSYLSIDISAKTAGGVCCYKIDPPEGADLTSSIVCFNTNIIMNLNSIEIERETIYPFHDSGLYACNFFFSSTKDSSISIKTNGIPTICHKFGVVSDQRITPHEGYIGERIKYENATLTSTTPFVHNEQSYDSASLWDVVYESLYEDLGGGNYKFIDNLQISY